MHEVFIFITIRKREATLMIIIARSPRNRSLHQLRYHIATTLQHRRSREEPPKPDTYVLPSSPRNYGDVCFLFLILNAKIPKFTYLKFEKQSRHQVEEWSTSTCIKQAISKPSNTVVLCYLALNAFFVGSFGEISLTSVKLIILNDFL